MTDKQCAIDFAHNQHSWYEREHPDVARGIVPNNPLQQYICPGLKPMAVPVNQPALFSRWPHISYFVENLGPKDSTVNAPGEIRTITTFDQSNIITSEVSEGIHAGGHTVALDLDVPAYLIPSSTPGHTHLYIDIPPIAWPLYEDLLKALCAAGVIEQGYAGAALARKHTALRMPWVHKQPAPVPDVNAPHKGCYICGDLQDHNGQRHALATGDGRTRKDTLGPAVPYTNLPEEPAF